MKAIELKAAIEKGRLSEDNKEQKWFNLGLDYALKMIDVYIRFQEPEAGDEWKEIMHVDSI